MSKKYAFRKCFFLAHPAWSPRRRWPCRACWGTRGGGRLCRQRTGSRGGSRYPDERRGKEVFSGMDADKSNCRFLFVVHLLRPSPCRPGGTGWPRWGRSGQPGPDMKRKNLRKFVYALKSSGGSFHLQAPPQNEGDRVPVQVPESDVPAVAGLEKIGDVKRHRFPNWLVCSISNYFYPVYRLYAKVPPRMRAHPQHLWPDGGVLTEVDEAVAACRGKNN